MNIYVGNLSPSVSDEDLNGLFSEHGNVSSAKVIRDNYTQTSRGFGFVEMPGQTEAQKAIDTLNSHELKGNAIHAYAILKTGLTGDAALEKSLRDHVGHEMGPIAKPETITFVDSLPKTRSGKSRVSHCRRV